MDGLIERIELVDELDIDPFELLEECKLELLIITTAANDLLRDIGGPDFEKSRDKLIEVTRR